MQNKNAKQHVQDVVIGLQNAQNCLNSALGSVEKPENRQAIQGTLDAVNGALTNANTTISNYKG